MWRPPLCRLEASVPSENGKKHIASNTSSSSSNKKIRTKETVKDSPTGRLCVCECTTTIRRRAPCGFPATVLRSNTQMCLSVLSGWKIGSRASHVPPTTAGWFLLDLQRTPLERSEAGRMPLLHIQIYASRYNKLHSLIKPITGTTVAANGHRCRTVACCLLLQQFRSLLLGGGGSSMTVFSLSFSCHSFPNEMHLLCSRGLFLLRIESPLCSFIVLYLFALGDMIWIAVSRDMRLDWRRKEKYTRTLYSLLLLYNTFQFIPENTCQKWFQRTQVYVFKVHAFLNTHRNVSFRVMCCCR